MVKSWIVTEERDWLANLQRTTPPPAGNKTEDSNLIAADPARLDLHLSYSVGLERGPIILRRGDSPPIMEDPEKPGNYTTDPDLQRIGACFITTDKQRELLLKTLRLFAGNICLDSIVTSPGEARAAARQVFVNYFHDDQCDTLQPPHVLELTFPGDIGRYATGDRSTLPHFPPLPKDLITGLSPFELGEEAVKELGAIYNHNYPNFFTDLANWKSNSQFRKTVRYNLEKYARLLVLLARTGAHDEAEVTRRSGNIVLMQGCGDLTMNEWNVAFVSDSSHASRAWTLLHAPREPLNDRKYTCLIKWRTDRADSSLQRLARKIRIVYPYQIASLQFLAPSLDVGSQSSIAPGRPDRHVFLQGEPIGHLIEFAVSGRRVCREGKVVALQNIAREFSDVRHLLKLPNLNPGEPCDEAHDTDIPEYAKVPRNFFNRSSRDPVWLGETALIQGDRNLRIAALSHAVQLDLRDLGAPERWIEIILEREARLFGRYQQVLPNVDLETRGQWRWVPEGRKKFLEIFFHRSHYPCSMIGTQAEDELSAEGEKGSASRAGLIETKRLFFLAHGHSYDEAGCAIDGAAKFLHSRGAWDALLFDEGLDVFQLARGQGDSGLTPRVPLRREQLRCVFWGNERGGGERDRT